MLEVVEVAPKQIAKFGKKEVIELILKMNKFNQREQAKVTYLRENALHPEWDLFCGIREAMGAQQ